MPKAAKRPGLTQALGGMTESRSHFAVQYKLNGTERYLVWYSDETDGVLLALPERVATFQDLEALDRYLLHKGLNRDSDAPSHYDFDRLADWLDKPSAATVNCPFILDCWNMLSDATRSLGSAAPSPSGTTDVCDKLFWGCNLPAVTPPGKHFTPEWSDGEIASISSVLSTGLKAFRLAAAYAG